MSFRRFKALTFDVVGTLIDFETGILDQLRASGGALAEQDDETLLAAYRQARAQPAAGWFPDDLERCHGELTRACGLPPDPAAARALRDSVARWPAFVDSVAALARLRRHFCLVATTNAQAWALAELARTLGEPFDVQVCVDDVRFEKPDPQFFAYTRGVLAATRDIRFEEILHVAQSQYHDIGVARRLGYQVCWIERRHGKASSGGTLEAPHTEPHYHYRSLAELAAAVDAELGHA